MTRWFRGMVMAWVGMVFGAIWLVGAEPGKDQPQPKIGIFALKGMAGRGALQDVWGDLLRSEAVRKELNITPTQLDELIKIAEKAGEAVRKNFEEMQELRDVAPEERKRRFAEITKRAKSEAEETRKQIERVLSPKQLTRLRQLALQLRGVEGLEDKEVQEQLKLTEEQKRQLKQVRDRVNQQMRELWRPGSPMPKEVRREKYRALLEDAEAKALALLTAAQKAQFEEMKGPKFDLSHLRRRWPSAAKP